MATPKQSSYIKTEKWNFHFVPPHKWTDIMTVTAMIGRCITQKH